jgi:hypothetical protein
MRGSSWNVGRLMPFADHGRKMKKQLEREPAERY